MLIFTPLTGAKYPEDCFKHPLDPGCFPNYPADRTTMRTSPTEYR